MREVLNFISKLFGIQQTRLSQRESRAERETHTSRDCFLVFLWCCGSFLCFFVYVFPYKETGRGHSSAFHYTIPYRMGFLPPRREEELSSFFCFSCSSSSKKKKKKERAAQQILKIASEQLLRFLRVKSTQIYAHTHTHRKKER